MSKATSKRPIASNKNEKESTGDVKNHWSENVYECAVCIGPEGTLNLSVDGGSDKGEFAYFDKLDQKRITYLNGRLEDGDVILEIQGQKVAGFTQRDVIAWLNHCCKSGNPVRIRVGRGGLLNKDLRLHLNTRFPKNSPDYDLQNTVRDNLYLRTVPCTTRPPREGEVNGVDYTFLTEEEFMLLERSGNLLESGIYEGNHYGTPRPPKECPVYSSRSNIISNNNNVINNNSNSSSVIPGIHPSSEGKRRRNRSSVEAMTAKTGEPLDSSSYNQSGTNENEQPQSPQENRNLEDGVNKTCKFNLLDDDNEPLPENWEKAYTDKGEPYYIDHNTGTSQWLDPRLSKNKKPVTECDDDELPYGWEKVDDPRYGTYYIDHVNKRTQYENPVIQAKQMSTSCLKEDQCKNNIRKSWNDNSVTELDKNCNMECDKPPGRNQEPSFSSRSNSVSQILGSKPDRMQPHLGQQYNNAQNSNSHHHQPPYLFTRNPAELVGNMVRTTLVKSSRGFGLTIVGGADEGDTEQFLQIKSVVPHGPAWQDGKLKTGDVLVYINDICVLGYSHQDVVSLFQSIPPGETVQLEVCQGYPLPFDPDDPNTEIVTTVAVSGIDMNSGYRGPLGSADSTDSQTRSAKSMPDLSTKPLSLTQRHNSADLLSNNGTDQSSSVPDFSQQLSSKPEFHTVEIVKGKQGFGFTIADGANGQKVKKILDRPRCQNLQEGDILIEINGQNIRGMSHTEVVQILKDCPYSIGANITIQRGGFPKVTKMKSADDIGVRRSVSNNSSHSFAALPHRTSDNYGPVNSALYRSKTPTADLYSSRDKESLHINRPKTPLVDTRYWPKPSFSETHVEQSDNHKYSQISNADNISLANRSDSCAVNQKQDLRDYSKHSHMSGQSNENSVANRPCGFSNSWKSDHGVPLRTAYNAASDKTSVNPSWYTTLGKLRDTYWADGGTKDTSKSPNYSPGRQLPEKPNCGSQYGYSQIKLPPPVPPHSRSNIDDSYEDSVFSNGSHSHSWTSKHSANFGDPTLNNPYEWGCNGSNSNYSRRENSQQYQPKNAIRNGLYSESSGHYGEVVNGPSDVSHHPDSVFHNSSVSHYSHSGHSSSGSHYDALRRRKHSTSFENENPMTSVAKSDKISVNSSVYNQQVGLRPPLLGGVPNYVEMTVTLLRQENGFGFRIVGGTEEGSQVSIGHIVPGGAADLDGRLCTGDEIMSVDHQSVINTSHHRVVQLMGNAALNGRVTLGIRRRISSIDSAYRTRSTESIYPYDVIVTRQENEGFGFVIISSLTRAGSTIGRIIEGSPADRCGQLHVGDRILAVNNISILDMHHGDIVNLIKDSGYSVTLTVGPPQDDTSSTTSISQRGEEQCFESDDQYHAVELQRGARGFGFSIRGGREFQNMPLFVLRIAENGPAHEDGKLLVGDQIIEINSINTKNMTHAEAIELIRQGGSVVRLLIKRPSQIPQAIIENPSPVSSGPSTYPHHAPVLPSNVMNRGVPDHMSQDYYTWGYDQR